MPAVVFWAFADRGVWFWRSFGIVWQVAHCLESNLIQETSIGDKNGAFWFLADSPAIFSVISQGWFDKSTGRKAERPKRAKKVKRVKQAKREAKQDEEDDELEGKRFMASPHSFDSSGNTDGAVHEADEQQGAPPQDEEVSKTKSV